MLHWCGNSEHLRRCTNSCESTDTRWSPTTARRQCAPAGALNQSFFGHRGIIRAGRTPFKPAFPFAATFDIRQPIRHNPGMEEPNNPFGETSDSSRPTHETASAPLPSPIEWVNKRKIRAKDSVDYVVVILHWGTEKATTPDDGQIQFAHALIDGGADAVIGHHPHVLQGIELYKSGIIVYSLGNLVFGGNSRDTYDTGLFEIDLGTHSVKYRFVPVRLEGWKLTNLSGRDAENVKSRMTELSSIFPRRAAFEEWLPLPRH